MYFKDTDNDCLLFERAVKHFSINNQFRKLMEECSELSVMASKSIDNKSLNTLDYLSAEMADVLVMISQIANHYQLWPKIHGWHKIKLGLLKERIDNEEKECMDEVST